MGAKTKDISNAISLDTKTIRSGRTGRLKIGERQAKNADAKNRIIKYLTDDSVELTADENAILDRWEHADLRMREKKLSLTDIAIEISEKYHVSRWTAENDIISTQEVFARSRKLNKKYLGHLHAERIDQVIEQYKGELFKDDRKPSEKEIQAFAKLLDSYTYALNSLPQTEEGKKAIAPVMMFALLGGEPMPVPMDGQAAIAAADEYIEYEETQKSDGRNSRTGSADHARRAASASPGNTAGPRK